MTGSTPRPVWYRRILWALIVALIGAVTLGCLALLYIDGSGAEELLWTSLSTVLFCLTALGCLFTWERGRWRPFAIVGMLISAAGIALFLFGTWFPPPSWEARTACYSFMTFWAVIAVLATHLCLLSLARPRPGMVWARYVTQGLAILLAILVTSMIVEFNDGLAKLMGVVALLTAFGTICVPILHWLHHARVQQPTVTTSLTFELTCPRCGEQQEIAAGRSPCRKCRLVFRIEIEEERCAKCGYVLYRLVSDRCPECGTPVLANAVATTIAPPAGSPASAQRPGA